jgi:hypothetical protein
MFKFDFGSFPFLILIFHPLSGCVEMLCRIIIPVFCTKIPGGKSLLPGKWQIHEMTQSVSSSRGGNIGKRAPQPY